MKKPDLFVAAPFYKTFAFILTLLGMNCLSAADQPITTPDGAVAATETAVLGGGCFWCMDAEYKTVPGVKKITSGFAGGHTPNPSYEEVCTGDTGHAEVVQIEFDPKVIPYEKILQLFWLAHDPTTLNRQGNDSGTQYRSIILYQGTRQKEAAEKSKAAAAKNFSDPIVTQIVPLDKFYPAEDYHQDYATKNPDQGYVRAVVAPKVQKFLKETK